MQNKIKHTWFFNQSPQVVWEYLTNAELLEQWLMKSDFQPIVGHKFHFICNKITYCEVLEVKPFSLLSYSWQTNSTKGNKPINSQVVWTLIPKENGTELQLLHDGFTVLEDYIGHNKGWTTLGNKFVELLNNYKHANTIT